jgi:hypothetical protein
MGARRARLQVSEKSADPIEFDPFRWALRARKPQRMSLQLNAAARGREPV